MYSASLTLLLAPGAFAGSRCNDIFSTAAQTDYDVNTDTWRTAPTHGEYHGGCCLMDWSIGRGPAGCCNAATCEGEACNALPNLPDHADADAMQACIGQPSGHKCPLKCLPGYTPKSINLPMQDTVPTIRPSAAGANIRFPLYTCSDGDWGLGWDDSGSEFYNLHIDPGVYTGATIGPIVGGTFHANKLQGHATWGGQWNRLAEFDWTLNNGKIHQCVALDTLPEYHTSDVDQWSYRCQNYYPEATYPGFCPRDFDGNQQCRGADCAADTPWTMPWLDQHECPVGYVPISTKEECEASCANYYSIQQKMVDLWCLPDTDPVNDAWWYTKCGGLNYAPWTVFTPNPEFTHSVGSNGGGANVCESEIEHSAFAPQRCLMRGGGIKWNKHQENHAHRTYPIICKKAPGPPVACKSDDSQPACANFESESDFTLANDGPGHALFTNTLPVDAGTLVIGNGPWERTNTVAQQTSSGCMFTQATTVVAPTATVYPDPTTVPPADLTCDVTQTTACSGTGSGTAVMSLKYSMAELVSHLDDAGRFEIYYHRITANPITGAGVDLLWIAQNACKIYVDVEFQCTGGNCVEVTTIVCASFAGIDTNNHGKLKIECKVPPSFDIATVQNPTGAGPHQDATLTVAENPATLFTGVTPSKNFANTAASWEYTSSNPIAAAGSAAVVVGSVTVRGSVTDGNIQAGSAGWTVVEDIYEAKYNLSLASATIDPLNMPVAVFFYSDPTSANLADLPSTAFPSSLATMPFLSKQKVEYGQITSNVNAFVRVIAKVTAASHWFKDLRVTKVEKDDQGAGYADDQTLLESCYLADALGVRTVADDNADILEAASTWTTDGNSYPLATIRCTEFIADSPSDTTPNVAAGDTVRLTLKWRLRKVSTTSGKAQLLQDAATSDPADQSVEVKLAISIGAATTDIQVADAAASKSVRSTTYIIIAVCVVAAGLLVAGLVVAYLCLRNRGADVQEMASPAKYSVAAVYDVSAPKEVIQDV